MKTTQLVASALLLGGLAVAAHAQASYGDLILGFEATGGTGAATNYEIDLGSVTSYASKGVGTYAIGDLSADLLATYGSSWASRSDLSLAIIGSTNTTQAVGSFVKKTVFASSAESGSFPATTWGQSGLNTTAIPYIGGLYGQTGASGAFAGNQVTTANINGASSGVGTTLMGITSGTGTSGSWTAQQQVDGAFGLSNPNSASFYTTASAITAGTGNLDVYVVANSPSGVDGTLLDASNGGSYFSLSNSGVLSFTVGTAIPEPSTYAMILGVAALGFVMLRRRQQVTA